MRGNKGNQRLSRRSYKLQSYRELASVLSFRVRDVGPQLDLRRVGCSLGGGLLGLRPHRDRRRHGPRHFVEESCVVVGLL